MLELMGKYHITHISHHVFNTWLELTSTNNDPNVVVKFFCDGVVKLEGMPHALRAYACTVLHVDICVCLYVSSCCLSVRVMCLCLCHSISTGC